MRRRILQDKKDGIFINGYEFVDMGLSVAWATCNIGAKKPEESGWYFQWAGTKPYNTDCTPAIGSGSKNYFEYPYAPYCSGSISSPYFSKYTAKDGKLILDPTDDAAHVHIGGGSRMPTEAEFEELIAACNTEWVENYNGTGVNGRLFTLKSDPLKTLFFPAAGYLSKFSWYSAGSYGYYWSSSLGGSNSRDGREMKFYSAVCNVSSEYRCYGYSVRGVLSMLEPDDILDVILYEKSTGELFQTPNPTAFDKDDYEPIGIVVIPSSHDVYGTGECGVLALNYASITTPDVGSVSCEYIYWGYQYNDVTELYNYNGCPSYGNYDNWGDVSFVALTGSGVSSLYLPTDRIGYGKMIPNKLPGSDQNSWYYNDSNQHVPSPYLADGSRNPDYYDTTIGAGNALSDFNGKTNTEILISKHTDQPTWKTDKTITNKESAGYSPAACACWRYSTVGTKQGDWYLPAMGEFGYTCVRFQKITNTLSALHFHFDKTYCWLNNGRILSSSEHSNYYAWISTPSEGHIEYYYGKNSSHPVHPFTRGKFEVRTTP